MHQSMKQFSQLPSALILPPRRLVSLPACLLMLTVAMPVSAQTWLSSGYRYSEYDGEFSGSESVVPVKLRTSTEDWGLSFFGSWISQADGESGIGDIFISGSVYDALYSEKYACGLDLQAGVKLPTASDALGSGQADIQFGTTLYHHRDAGMVYLSYDHRINGDSTSVQYGDYDLWSAGGIAYLTGSASLGVFYDYLLDEVAASNAETLTVFIGIRGRNIALRPYISNTLSGPEQGSYTAGFFIDFRLSSD